MIRDTPAAVDEDQDPAESQTVEDPPSAATGVDPRVVTRVIRNLLDAEARDRAFTQGSTAIFLHICGLLEINLDGIDLHRRNTKRTLFERIINQVQFIFSSQA